MSINFKQQKSFLNHKKTNIVYTKQQYFKTIMSINFKEQKSFINHKKQTNIVYTKQQYFKNHNIY